MCITKKWYTSLIIGKIKCIGTIVAVWFSEKLRMSKAAFVHIAVCFTENSKRIELEFFQLIKSGNKSNQIKHIQIVDTS